MSVAAATNHIDQPPHVDGQQQPDPSPEVTQLMEMPGTNQQSQDNDDGLEQISLETQATTPTATATDSSPSSLTSTNDEQDENGSESDNISSHGERTTTTASTTAKPTKKADSQQPIKCSAVHALERDMPDFDYSHLVEELRAKILENIQQNPGMYSQKEIAKCKQDDWFLTRYLLRHKMDIEEAFEQLKRTMRYHHESLFASIRPEDFPSEFYQLGGTFSYPEDRKGNKTMHMRVRVHRKTPEIKSVVEGFLYYNLIRTDQLANGRGIAVVMDCTGGGLQNADLDLLFFFVSSLKNYFPRGLSYILVHNLPWILKPFWHLAKAWVSEEHRELIKFSNDRTIFEYIDRENLPDFLGGTCELDYRKAPANCTNLNEAAKLWGIDKQTARNIFNKFKDNLPPETIDRLEREFFQKDDDDDEEQLSAEEKGLSSSKALNAGQLDKKTMIAQID